MGHKNTWWSRRRGAALKAIPLLSFCIFLFSKFIIIPLSHNHIEPWTTISLVSKAIAWLLVYIYIKSKASGYYNLIADMAIGFYIGEAYNQYMYMGYYSLRELIIWVGLSVLLGIFTRNEWK